MLIERCFLVKSRGYWEGMGEYTNRKSEGLRMPGWLLLGVSLFGLYRLSQLAWGHMGIWDVLFVVLPLFVAVVFLKISSGFSVRHPVLIRIDEALIFRDEEDVEIGREQLVHLPAGPHNRLCAYEVSEFTHVVFGMIDYPLPGSRELRVESFAVYLARVDGEPFAVVDACFDNMSAYQLARRICALTGLSFIEMGKGQPFRADDVESMIRASR